MMTIFRIFLLSLLTLLLAACGQRGPLYLPDESVRVVLPTQASQPAAVPPETLDTGSEHEDANNDARPDGDQPEDEQANGL